MPNVALQESVQALQKAIVGVAVYALSTDATASSIKVPEKAEEVKVRNFRNLRNVKNFGRDDVAKEQVQEIVKLIYELNTYTQSIFTKEYNDIEKMVRLVSELKEFTNPEKFRPSNLEDTAELVSKLSAFVQDLSKHALPHDDLKMIAGIVSDLNAFVNQILVDKKTTSPTNKMAEQTDKDLKMINQIVASLEINCTAYFKKNFPLNAGKREEINSKVFDCISKISEKTNEISDIHDDTKRRLNKPISDFKIAQEFILSEGGKAIVDTNQNLNNLKKEMKNNIQNQNNNESSSNPGSPIRTNQNKIN